MTDTWWLAARATSWDTWQAQLGRYPCLMSILLLAGEFEPHVGCWMGAYPRMVMFHACSCQYWHGMT